MSNRREKNARRQKRAYIKPEVKKVRLSPEEAVLGFCKTNGKWGAGAPNCGIPSPCSGTGS